MENKVLFNEDGITVTNTHLTGRGKSQKISEITTMNCVTLTTKKFWPVLLIVSGIILLFVFAILGLIALIGGIVWYVKSKPKYSLEYETNTGIVSALVFDKPEMPNKIFDAIEKAMEATVTNETANSNSSNGDASAINEASNDDSGNSEPYFYDDAICEIENAVSEYDTNEKLKDRYRYIFISIIIYGEMSVEEKCKALERLNQKVKTLFNDNYLSYFQFNCDILKATYSNLEKNYDEDAGSMVSAAYSDYKSDYLNAKLKDFNYYLGELLGYAGLLNSLNSDGDGITIEDAILDKYDLPTIDPKKAFNLPEYVEQEKVSN